MNPFKKISLCAALLPLAFSAAAHAQPLAVTTEHIAELEALHERAMDSLLKNDFQGAIRMYSDILLLEPDDETAYTGLGQIYLILGHFKKAHEAFREALEINPENEVALIGIQRILDPDGTEGMVSRLQAETEAYLPAAAPAETLRAPEAAPRASMAKRQGALKAKKGSFFSAPAWKAPEAKKAPEAAPASVPVKIRYAPRPGRLGLLHAQRVQMALRQAGFYEGPVNGMLGPITKGALKNFQEEFGLEPSGRVDPPTWAKLSDYLRF